VQSDQFRRGKLVQADFIHHPEKRFHREGFGKNILQPAVVSPQRGAFLQNVKPLSAAGGEDLGILSTALPV